MAYCLRVVGLAGFQIEGDPAPPGAYLSEYDPEAYDGQGVASFSADKDEALRFATVHEILSTLRLSPQARPLRADGKPNRPLTAYSFEIVSI